MSRRKKFRALRGMPDILPPEGRRRGMIEETIKEVFRAYGYEEIRTPLLEETEVFARSIGAETDIVEKEMYSFLDRGGKNVALRPECTASVIRSFVENGWDKAGDSRKFFYCGPMFRGERPQKGRLRQFHQAGVELIGSREPYADTELLISAVTVLRAAGLNGHTLLLNSLGCASDRKRYREVLRAYLQKNSEKLCEDCLRRSKANVLRVLDCKKKACSAVIDKAPSVTQYLCRECASYYERVKGLLRENGLDFEERPDLVRGLDYYTGIVFEIVCSSLGAQDAVAAGGRYDDLCAQMGGADVPATGYAIGIERLLLALGGEPEGSFSDGVFVIPMEESFRDKAFDILRRLRTNAICSDWDLTGRSFKASMRKANRRGWGYVLIIGDEEMRTGKYALKNMDTGEQKSAGIESVINELKTARVKQERREKC